MTESGDGKLGYYKPSYIEMISKNLEKSLPNKDQEHLENIIRRSYKRTL